MERRLKYYAFISYKREDEKWAKWLQNRMENFRLPRSVRRNNIEAPKRIRPVFRDKTDILPGPITEQLKREIDQSKYLIIICSPKSAQSGWVGRGIEYMIEKGRADDIIPFIVEGLPHSSDPATECFHEALRSHCPDLLGVNINEQGFGSRKGKKERALLQVIAKIANTPFDSLYRRHKRRRRRKNFLNIILLLISIILLTVGGKIFMKLHDDNRTHLSRELTFRSENLYERGALADALYLQLKSLEIREFPTAEDNLRKIIHSLRSSGFIQFESITDEFITPPDTISSFNGRMTASLNSTSFSLRIMDKENGSVLHTLPHSGFVYKADFHPYRDMILTIDTDFAISLWNLSSGSRLMMKYDEADAKHAFFSPDGESIIFITNKGRLNSIDIDEYGINEMGFIGDINVPVRLDYSWTAMINENTAGVWGTDFGVVSPCDEEPCTELADDSDYDLDSLGISREIDEFIPEASKHLGIVCFSPDRKYLAASALKVLAGKKKSDEISIISCSSGDLIQKFTVGGRVDAMGFDESGERLYIKTNAGETLSLDFPALETLVEDGWKYLNGYESLEFKLESPLLQFRIF